MISDSGGEDGNTNYGKIATAIDTIQKQGVKVSLPDINRCKFGFHPDAKTNEIVYGLKPIQGIGTKVAKAIIDNQPYNSLNDFYNKMQIFKKESDENKFGYKQMITLIKAGCFDKLENKPRTEIMKDFIELTTPKITKISINNLEELKELGLLTKAQLAYEYRFYKFRSYVYQKKFFVKQSGKSASTSYYFLERKYAEPYFIENFIDKMVEFKDYEYNDDGFIIVKRGSLDKVIDKECEEFKSNVFNNKEFLDKINENRVLKNYNEEASGSIPKWEMESLCYYYTAHELADVNKVLYNISDFYDLSPEPEVSYNFKYRGQIKGRYKLSRICGTVIDKNKDKHTVSLLTPTGVVTLKFYKGQFSFYDKGISKINEDGSKTVIEKSWFERGNKLLITGFRKEEQFIPKQYKDSIYKHSVQLIKEIKENGELVLQSERIDSENGEYNE